MTTSANLISDIPEGLAVAAFNGTSFSPERRAAAYRKDYADTLAADYAMLTEHAQKGGTLELLDAEFSSYRAGYAQRFRAWLSSRSHCISSMITGPSNFPVRRAQKRNDIEHRRMGEVIDFRARALRAIIRNLRPDLRPIMAGDADAIERLEIELQRLTATQERMKAINAAHKAYKRKPESLIDAPISEQDKETVRTYKPAYSWEPHPFAPFQLSNNSANMRRIQQRIETLTAAKAMPDQVQQGDGVRIEDCPADNRVRLFFNSKPDADVRTRLKGCGFRWAPSIGAWQAYRNDRSLTAARGYIQQGAEVAA